MDIQLLVVLAFIVMSIFDAVGRRRKKQERMEEMEREEREEWATGTGKSAEGAEVRGTRGTGAPPREVDPRAGVEEWEWEGRGAEAKGEGTPASMRSPAPQSPQKAPRQTADSMIPDELWGILTGQAPPPRQEVPPTAPPPPPAPTPAPTQGSRPGPSPMRKPQPPQSPRTGPAARSPAKAPPSAKPLPKKPALDPTEVPWRDISSGEIGSEGGTLVAPIRGEIGAPASVTRVGRGPSPYVRDLRTGGREVLRRAIVLQEVLGPPVTLRPGEKRVWETWDE